MTYEQIIKELKNKIYRTVYFLAGDEPYYIDLITNYIFQNILEDPEKAFNQTVLYGKDTDVRSIISNARRFPMMANHNVVVVKEAQHLKDIDELIHYVENPLKSTILAISYKYKKLDKRTKLFKSISEKGVYFESARLYDDKIPDWVMSFVNKKGYSIEINASMLLSEFLGNDLSKIVNEIEKLIITLPKGEKKITPGHIEKNIGISKDYNTFELNKALIQKNVLKANRIADYFGKNQKQNPINLVISSLYYTFNKVLAYYFIKDKSRKNVAAVLKVNPFFVSDYEIANKNYKPKKTVEIISLLREFDLKSKGVGNVSTPPGELLKEMIYRILH